MNFRITLLSHKLSTKLPNDPNCSIHVFYKARLQCLTKKRVLQWLKKISAYFDHYNLIT